MKKHLQKLLFISMFLFLSSCEFKLPNLSEHFFLSSNNISSSSISTSSSSNNLTSSSINLEEKNCEDVSIHFLELGNQFTGDSVYIKVGEIDILIDAGSRDSSAPTLINYINKYCIDNTLEYVIATHAHQDHIAGFVGKNNDGIFYNYTCETIIDFPKVKTNSQIYQKYQEARAYQVNKGSNHYTALDCYKEINGGQRSYNLGKNVTLNILYQKYYETNNSEENNYSVCVLLSQGDNHFLFTGDLESSGEKSLVESNNLPHVKVYKGGHHGSDTSNTDLLLNTITPENICMCTCAGTPEYTTVVNSQFPCQETVNRMAKHTENIYCTSQIDEEKSIDKYVVKSMNGNIVVTSTDDEFSIIGTNNSIKLKDTEWFKKYRTWPS